MFNETNFQLKSQIPKKPLYKFMFKFTNGMETLLYCTMLFQQQL